MFRLLIMKLLDITLDTPQENLALDEALLEWSELQEQECLRFWESPEHFVVMGAGSPIKTDVNLDACIARNIPVLRRVSGGGTVLQGPGCFNYTLVLDRETRPDVDTIINTNDVVLQVIARSIAEATEANPDIKGVSDLATGGLKFGGSAQRRRKRFIMLHGTVLHGFDLQLISDLLGTPEKMPEYRANRSHESFLTNVKLDPVRLRQILLEQWNADSPLDDWPEERTKKLARTKYADQQWITSI